MRSTRVDLASGRMWENTARRAARCGWLVACIAVGACSSVRSEKPADSGRKHVRNGAATNATGLPEKQVNQQPPAPTPANVRTAERAGTDSVEKEDGHMPSKTEAKKDRALEVARGLLEKPEHRDTLRIAGPFLRRENVTVQPASEGTARTFLAWAKDPVSVQKIDWRNADVAFIPCGEGGGVVIAVAIERNTGRTLAIVMPGD